MAASTQIYVDPRISLDQRDLTLGNNKKKLRWTSIFLRKFSNIIARLRTAVSSQASHLGPFVRIMIAIVRVPIHQKAADKITLFDRTLILICSPKRQLVRS